MQILLLVLILLVPYALLSLSGASSSVLRLDQRMRARVALSIFFGFTGIGHFIKTDALVAMMPAALPYRLELVYLTGIFELLGAVGIWITQIRALTGACLIIMLIAFLPVNIYAALQRVDFGGHELGPVYLLARVPVQLLLIVWTAFATLSFRPKRSDAEESGV